MPDAPGIACPRCGCTDLRDPSGRAPGPTPAWDVTHTERRRGYIRRRRVCRHCGYTVHTRETLEHLPPPKKATP